MFVTVALRRSVNFNGIWWLQPIVKVTCKTYSTNVPSSGDSGPGKNYRKKLKKETNKFSSLPGRDEKNVKHKDMADLQQTVTEGKRMLEQLESSHDKARDRTLKRVVTDDLETPSALKQELKEILMGIKTIVPSEAHQRKRFAMPDKKELVKLQRPALKGQASEHRISIMNPSGGPRLGIFQLPGPQTKILPTHKPTLMEEEHTRKLAALMAMEPRSQFELLMETPHQQIYPVDNDLFYKEEQEVGFEEHVLLDHLLEPFPKRGPVRHFMELVVTGLSKNPHYTVQEKHDIVGWYKEYLEKFSSEDLQL